MDADDERGQWMVTVCFLLQSIYFYEGHKPEVHKTYPPKQSAKERNPSQA